MNQTISLKKGYTLGVLFFVFTIAHAQVALVASGGTASGNDATANYTIGQAIQETLMSPNAEAIQGIQFYFPSATLTVIDLATNMEVSIYPNPTSSFFNLKIEGQFDPNLKYELFNLIGQPLLHGNILGSSTEIDVNHLPNATYLLKISNKKNSIIKTYKLIKN